MYMYMYMYVDNWLLKVELILIVNVFTYLFILV